METPTIQVNSILETDWLNYPLGDLFGVNKMLPNTRVLLANTLQFNWPPHMMCILLIGNS